MWHGTTMESEQSRFPLIAWISLIVAGLTAFWPTVWFDFVNWDDPAYVWYNDLIKSWSPASLAGVATETVTRNYAPLTIFSLLIDHTLWGMNPSGYHATNVLLHLINGVLVAMLMRQLTGSRFVAWVTAALFLVHPVQIETVAWISSRKGLLSASFMLAALIARLRPEPRAADDGWYILWLIAALLSKALAVVLPAIVLCYDLWVRRQKFSDALVRQMIPGTLCLLLLLKTMGAQNTILGGVRSHMELSLPQILAVDMTILSRYIGMLLWPANLCVLYNPPTSGIWLQVLAATLGWGVFAGLAWRARQNNPLIWIALASFLLLLFPVLNFFRITTLMNDRYLYLPCISVFGLLAGGLQRLLLAGERHAEDIVRLLTRSAKWTAALLAVGGALQATTLHLPVWQNSMSLWTHAKSRQPDLAVVRIQMAWTLHDLGQRREGIRELQRALTQCNPDQLDRQRIHSAIEDWSAELVQQNQELLQATHDAVSTRR